MAGDGLVCGGDTIFGHNTVKVFRLNDGRIAGVAGGAFNAAPFINWLNDGGDKPDFGEDSFDALVLHPDGSVQNYDKQCRAIPEAVPTACGSGRDIAIGAMEAGATPEEAVDIASRRNAYTGGKITVLSIERGQ